MDSAFIEFVNTRWSASHESHRDPLQDAEWVKAFIARWHLPAQPSLSERQMNELMALRSTIGEAVAAIASGGAISDDTMRQVDGHLRSTPLHYSLKPHRDGLSAVLEPELSGWNGVARGIVLSFAQFLAEHEPGRLRECRNPDCRWVFYDETKNASRKWCGNTCASRIKVRQFRERQKRSTEKE